MKPKSFTKLQSEIIHLLNASGGHMRRLSYSSALEAFHQDNERVRMGFYPSHKAAAFDPKINYARLILPRENLERILALLAGDPLTIDEIFERAFDEALENAAFCILMKDKMDDALKVHQLADTLNRNGKNTCARQVWEAYGGNSGETTGEVLEAPEIAVPGSRSSSDATVERGAIR